MASALIKDLKQRMEKTIGVYEEELQSVRAGRANPTLLERISVEYYGQMTPLNQVAGISAPEPRLLTIQPWDASLIPVIEKEILKSDLGLNPSNDGKLIRLVIPQLTEERRKELVKVVRKDAENAKVALRNLRRDAMDTLKKQEKNNEITEDDRKGSEEDVQKVMDEFVARIDKITAAKESELMEI